MKNQDKYTAICLIVHTLLRVFFKRLHLIYKWHKLIYNCTKRYRIQKRPEKIEAFKILLVKISNSTNLVRS